MGRGAYPGREGTILPMALGYDGKLFILAFDHRGSFQKKMFGIEGDPDDEQTRTISDAKHLIWEACRRRLTRDSTSTRPASSSTSSSVLRSRSRARRRSAAS